MLNRHIGLDRAVNELSSDLCRLAYTWAIPHLDRDGRICGDPAALKSTVFPRRDDVTAEQMQAFIIEWHRAGLVTWYETAKDKCLQFLGFRKNQPNLRYEREAASLYPDPKSGKTPAELRQESDTKAGDMPRNGIEGKGRERNTKGAVAPSEETTVPAINRPIYHLVLNAFTAKSADTKFDFKREGPHIKAIEEKANDRDDPEGFAKAVLVTFWRLTHSQDKFWRGQPFLPSVLNSGGIWSRVLKELENAQADTLSPEIQEIIRGLWK